MAAGLIDKAKALFLERPQDKPAEGTPQNELSPYNDADLLELWRQEKKLCFENRWIWERGWMRNIHYVNNRHWIEYVRRSNEWRDVRLAKWFPKPVTNKMAEGVQALRAMFCSVNIGVNVRPGFGGQGASDPINIAVAAKADEYGPVLHEEHHMDDVMDESDFWFIVTGNVFLHTYLERDIKHGFIEAPLSECVECQEHYLDTEIEDEGGACPHCGAMEFVPAMNPETNAPLTKKIAKGKGVTVALSPFEVAFNPNFARFEDVPIVTRLRWRSKTYYENHPTLKMQMAGYAYSKAPSETSLQLFRSLPYHNDMGVAPFLNTGSGGAGDEEGAPEYEVWVRPCDAYPDGLVFRVVGDSNPRILHLEKEEALPGPIPYVDAKGNPVFTFAHAAFEQRGGRIYGTSPLDAAIQKQNQLNQLDSFILMIVHRMSNPLWLVPKGAEIEKFTGEPGLVVKWNPLTVGGNAKPERVDGGGPSGSLFQVREQYLKDIEESLGTYDVVKGSKPAGVEAFSAMQLLVERSQSRFASAFKARGNLYKDWFKFALEIEREFGPEERTHGAKGAAGTWTARVFKNADLQGSFSVIVEDGSNTPKTSLGIRAAVEHLNTLGFIDPNDPDQKYKVFQLFGQPKLSPSLDIHMQAALRKQQAFEEWAANPQAQQLSVQLATQELQAYEQQLAQVQMPVNQPQVDPKTGQPMPTDPNAEAQQMQAALPPPPPLTKHTPLAWKPWYSAPIHKQEFLKWANSDRMVELLQQNSKLEDLLVAHLQEIDGAIAMAQMQAAGPQPQKPGGAGMAMQNSNGESGGAQNAGNPGGQRQGAA